MILLHLAAKLTLSFAARCIHKNISMLNKNIDVHFEISILNFGFEMQALLASGSVKISTLSIVSSEIPIIFVRFITFLHTSIDI